MRNPFSNKEHLFRSVLIFSNAAMWCVTGTVLGRPLGDGGPITVNQDNIYISLPVYISSIAATAVCTWVVAKYDNRRIRQVSELKATVERLMTKMDEHGIQHGEEKKGPPNG